MMSLFEGLLEYYRVTGDPRWKRAALNLYEKIRTQEITVIGNGGGDQPYHPAVMGEAWDRTAVEQANPNMKRMMETCTGVTWLKLCSQILRLTGDPSTVDEIERYAYNGLIGAMKPAGDGFSYVNLLNGVKTNPEGWGAVLNKVRVTCCNLNGPMGLAYLPYVAILNSGTGPVINLYNGCTATASTPKGQPLRLHIETSPHASNRAADNQQALVRGPIVLARDENIDPDYDKPVMIAATNGHVEVVAVPPALPGTRLQFRVPTQDGFIQMVDYASVDNWNGKHVRTWLPRPVAGNRPQ